MSALTRATAKVVVGPVRHESGGRVTRVTVRAYIVPRGRGLQSGDEGCPHSHGHRTTKAAVKCGAAMWRLLPAVGAA